MCLDVFEVGKMEQVSVHNFNIYIIMSHIYCLKNVITFDGGGNIFEGCSKFRLKKGLHLKGIILKVLL